MVAAVDAVRSRDAGEPPAATATTELLERAPLAGQAALLGVRGELLLYGDGCSVERLELPSLVLDPIEGACWPRGTRSPSGEVVAVCRGETTEVYSTVGSFQNSHLGCTPAWQTGGTLTLSRHGEVVTPDGTVLIPSSELERAARRHPTVSDALTRVRAFAWSEDERFLAIATPSAVTIVDVTSLARFDRIGSGLRSVTLPLSAQDLVWR